MQMYWFYWICAWKMYDKLDLVSKKTRQNINKMLDMPIDNKLLSCFAFDNQAWQMSRKYG